MNGIAGYDAWKTASPYDNEYQWLEECSPTCEAELDYAPEGHECNDNCAVSPDEDLHFCGWNGVTTADCVGSDGDYTRYWTCAVCETEHQDEVRG